MFGRTNRDAQQDPVEELARSLVRAAGADDDEIEAAVSSPFLYSRIKASIAAEQREGADRSKAWMDLFAVARLAVPAMTLLAILAAFHPWSEPSAPRAYTNRAVVAAEPEIATLAATACALSNSQQCAISNNEVLATIFAEDNRETQR